MPVYSLYDVEAIYVVHALEKECCLQNWDITRNRGFSTASLCGPRHT